MTLIEQFLQGYLREYDYYLKVARLCAQDCERFLEQNGIRTIVTHRAKRPDRLQQKIVERAKTKNYKSVDDIYSDIVDLSGVRIAVYFPGDEKTIHKLLGANFIVEKHKAFSGSVDNSPVYKSRFAGYCAQHYLVRLKPDLLSEPNHRYGQARIEIQVASVLMHAWSEVEHDLTYKPITGSLSIDEYAILDEINGLVIAGEIALERLQRAVQARVAAKEKRFSNHYELASYLYDVMRPLLKDDNKEPSMGRTDVLMSFLQSAGMATASDLSNFTTNVDPYVEDRPIAEQIMDRILEARPGLYGALDEIRQQVESSSRYRPVAAYREGQNYIEDHNAIGLFLSRWIVFERAITKLAELIHPGQPIKWRLLNETLPYLGFDQTLLNQIETIRNIRNHLVHGIEMPHQDKLVWAARALEQILFSMRERAQGQAKEVMDAAIRTIETSSKNVVLSKLWALREKGVRLRNQLITPQELGQWNLEFEQWHSDVLNETQKVSPELKGWLQPLDQVKQWDLTSWVNEEHRRKLNMISEILDRTVRFLTRGLG
jgi:ppGpp synthetase/RelA/SpoT-type nucleotidyltranferase